MSSFQYDNAALHPTRALAVLGPAATLDDVKPFEPHAFDFRTLAMPEALTLVHTLDEFKPDIVLIFGGDGTLNRHLDTLVAHEVPVLVVPMGSGNDFAMSHGINSVDDALKVWAAFPGETSTVIETDLGSAHIGDHFRYFSCCLNVGLDAEAAHWASRMPGWLKSRSGYFLGGILALMSYKRRELSVVGDGPFAISICERGWFACVSNTPTYGGGLKIAPQADMADGLLELTYLNECCLFTIMRHLPKIKTGTHIVLKEVTIAQTNTLVIETEKPQPIFSDGEFFGFTPCDITVAEKALRVVQMRDLGK